MPEYVVSRLEKLLQTQQLVKPTIGVLGYAYKANVDDIRETPAQDIVRKLSAKYRVLVNDELVKTAPVKLVPLARLLTGSTVVILITPHSIYKKIKFALYPQIKLVLDTRGLFTNSNLKHSQAQLINL